MASDRFDNIELLHPLMRTPALRLASALEGTPLRPFETYRSPERQDMLFRQGTTQARAWQSPHQYGLAIDFVPYIDGRWTWDVDTELWMKLSTTAASVGLVCPIHWDRPHVEHIAFLAIRKAWRPKK